MSVRVIRILEHIYPDHQSLENDMFNWYIQPNSVRSGLSNGLTIRSAILFPETVEPPAVAVHADAHTPTVIFKSSSENGDLYGVICDQCSRRARDYVKCEHANVVDIPAVLFYQADE